MQHMPDTPISESIKNVLLYIQRVEVNLRDGSFTEDHPMCPLIDGLEALLIKTLEVDNDLKQMEKDNA